MRSVRRGAGEANLDLVEPIQEEAEVSHRRSAGGEPEAIGERLASKAVQPAELGQCKQVSPGPDGSNLRLC